MLFRSPMVASTGAEYVILGHSERRQYYGETSETLREKVKLALENNLTPIFCIGEVLEQRENGTYLDVVKAQIEEALFDLSAEDFSKLILAYEPVWAIGTGKTATDDQAEEMHAFIRNVIAEKYGKEVIFLHYAVSYICLPVFYIFPVQVPLQPT